MKTSMLTICEIRKAVVAKLAQAYLQFVGDQVFESRTEMAWPQEGCFLAVYTKSSSFDNQDTSPVFYKVETEVVVDVVVQSAIDVDGEHFSVEDIIDIVTSEVVNVLSSYPRPQWMIQDKVASSDFVLKNVEKDMNGKGETVKGAQSVTFTATWFFEPVTRNDPLNDWREMHTHIQFDNTEDVIASSAGRVVTSNGQTLRVAQENNGESFRQMIFDSEIGGQ